MRLDTYFLYFVFSVFGYTTSAQTETKVFELIIFEGSDWCSNCIRLEKDVLSNADFQSFLLEKKINLRRIDFPQKKLLDKNHILYNVSVAEKYSFDGVFPTVLLIEIRTNNIIKLDYTNENHEKFITKIEAKTSLKL